MFIVWNGCQVALADSSPRSSSTRTLAAGRATGEPLTVSAVWLESQLKAPSAPNSNDRVGEVRRVSAVRPMVSPVRACRSNRRLTVGLWKLTRGEFSPNCSSRRPSNRKGPRCRVYRAPNS